MTSLANGGMGTRVVMMIKSGDDNIAAIIAPALITKMQNAAILEWIVTVMFVAWSKFQPRLLPTSINRRCCHQNSNSNKDLANAGLVGANAIDAVDVETVWHVNEPSA